MTRQNVIWAGAAGATGLWLSMPNPLTQMPLCVFLYPAMLYVLGIKAPSWGEAFRWCWLTSIAGCSAVLYWVSVPIHMVAGFPLPMAAVVVVLLSVILGLYAGIFGLLCRALSSEKVFVRFALLTLGWYLHEWLCSWVFSGFPWIVLGAAFTLWPVCIQLCAYIGAYGLSAIIALTACLGAEGFLRLLCSGNKKQGYVFTSLACAICALTLGVGVLRMKGAEAFLTARINDDPVKVAMVQGNIDQLQKWDAIFRHRTIETYIKLSERIDWNIPLGGALLIWPETAMPFFYQNSSDREIIKLFAAGQNVPLLFGAPGYAFSPYGERIFNRAYLLEPGVPGPDVFYEKEHLVPFGEYVPSWLDFPVLSGLLQEIGNFAPGEKVAPLRMQSWPDVEGDSQRARLALGVLICYETIFPDLVRQRVADGANLLVNISNDAWFGDTSGPEQHLRMAALRAVEMSRYVARGANTGISAVIDPLGRILERGDLNREQVVSGTVAGVPDLTVYFHIAPFMWPVAVISLIVWLVWVLMLRKQNRSV